MLSLSETTEAITATHCKEMSYRWSKLIGMERQNILNIYIYLFFNVNVSGAN